MSSYEELDQRFQEIKELAWRNDKLSSVLGVKVYSRTDTQYFCAMQYIYEKYKLRQVHKDVAEKEVECLRLRYISDKQLDEQHAKIIHDLEDKRRNIGKWAKQLMHPKEISYKTIFKILFCDLIPALTDEVTGRLILEGAGYILFTGVNNLSEAEKNELQEFLKIRSDEND